MQFLSSSHTTHISSTLSTPRRPPLLLYLPTSLPPAKLTHLRNPHNQVPNKRLHRPQRRHILPSPMMQLDIDGVLVRPAEAHAQMRHVLDQFPPGPFDGYDAGFDVDFNWREQGVLAGSSLSVRGEGGGSRGQGPGASCREFPVPCTGAGRWR